jgi:DUF971 family protein
MKNKPVFIRQIQQKDNHTFSIIWSDGQEQQFRLCVLQRSCPCAQCCDEQTGERVIHPESVKEDVRAFNIQSVGRYALKIKFTSGCSAGIYTFDYLRSLAKGLI